MARVQFKTEYMFKASPSVIYLFLTQPTCLVRWFCDKVDNVGDKFTFSWEWESEDATMLDDIEDELVTYQWDERPKEFLKFRIYKTDITSETILEITDFCDDDESEDQQYIWDMYIKKFKIYCGG
ncbi:MAG: START-like domain-containing protein [Bacteroidota bacterium]|nr:START-like domain-containing protein [Bacteroidota bacterium]